MLRLVVQQRVYPLIFPRVVQQSRDFLRYVLHVINAVVVNSNFLNVDSLYRKRNPHVLHSVLISIYRSVISNIELLHYSIFLFANSTLAKEESSAIYSRNYIKRFFLLINYIDETIFNLLVTPVVNDFSPRN